MIFLPLKPNYLTMKFTFSAIVLTLLLSATANAQTYFNLGFGYGIGVAPGSYTFESTANSNGNSYTETTKSAISYGKGVQIVGAVGSMINQHVGVELGVSYLIGAKFKEAHTFNSSTSISQNSAKLIRLAPTVKLTTGNDVKPYMKMGVSIGINPKIEQNVESTNSTSNDKSSQTILTRGGIAIGFTGAVGVTAILNKYLSFFSELNIITQSWSPKKSTYTKYIENGIDQLGSFSGNIETDYVSSVSSSDPTTPSSPSKALKIFEPLSSVGLNVGLHIELGGTKTRRK